MIVIFDDLAVLALFRKYDLQVRSHRFLSQELVFFGSINTEIKKNIEIQSEKNTCFFNNYFLDVLR